MTEQEKIVLGILSTLAVTLAASYSRSLKLLAEHADLPNEPIDNICEAIDGLADALQSAVSGDVDQASRTIDGLMVSCESARAKGIGQA